MISYIMGIRPKFGLKTVNLYDQLKSAKLNVFAKCNFIQVMITFLPQKLFQNNPWSFIFKKQAINNDSNKWYICYNYLYTSSFLVRIKQCGPNKANLRYFKYNTVLLVNILRMCWRTRCYRLKNPIIRTISVLWI